MLTTIFFTIFVLWIGFIFLYDHIYLIQIINGFFKIKQSLLISRYLLTIFLKSVQLSKFVRCKSPSINPYLKLLPIELFTNIKISHVIYFFIIFCFDGICCLGTIFSVATKNVYLIFKKLILIFCNASFFFNSLPNDEYSNLLNVATFSNSR